MTALEIEHTEMMDNVAGVAENKAKPDDEMQ